MTQPRVTDNDSGEITVTLEDKELRGWSYASDDERRQKMLQAREYVEGWCDRHEEPVILDDAQGASLRQALIEVTKCETALRMGGPAPEDLEGLSIALEKAVEIAANALDAAQPQVAPVDVLPTQHRDASKWPSKADIEAAHNGSSAVSEDIARTIALSYGRDPDALTEWTEMCDAHNRPVPIWKVYEEQAEALLASYSITRPQSRTGEA